MIYISHLLPDHEMSEIIEQTGVGIESIEFSIADNLDHLNDSIGSYRERLKFMDCRGLTLHGPFMNIDPAAFSPDLYSRYGTWGKKDHLSYLHEPLCPLSSGLA